MWLVETTVVVHLALVTALRSTTAAFHALIVVCLAHSGAAREKERTYFRLFGLEGLYPVTIVLDGFGLQRRRCRYAQGK
jgi:hypothetical protein